MLWLAGLVGEEGTVVSPFSAAQSLLCLQQLGQHGPQLQLAICNLQDSHDGVKLPGQPSQDAHDELLILHSVASGQQLIPHVRGPAHVLDQRLMGLLA